MEDKGVSPSLPASAQTRIVPAYASLYLHTYNVFNVRPKKIPSSSTPILLYERSLQQKEKKLRYKVGTSITSNENVYSSGSGTDIDTGGVGGGISRNSSSRSSSSNSGSNSRTSSSSSTSSTSSSSSSIIIILYIIYLI